MKTLLSMICITLLAGCGADVATTAATGAAIKKQEIDATQQTKERVEKKIDQATDAIQQRAVQQGSAEK